MNINTVIQHNKNNNKYAVIGDTVIEIGVLKFPATLYRDMKTGELYARHSDRQCFKGFTLTDLKAESTALKKPLPKTVQLKIFNELWIDLIFLNGEAICQLTNLRQLKNIIRLLDEFDLHTRLEKNAYPNEAFTISAIFEKTYMSLDIIIKNVFEELNNRKPIRDDDVVFEDMADLFNLIVMFDQKDKQ